MPVQQPTVRPPTRPSPFHEVTRSSTNGSITNSPTSKKSRRSKTRTKQQRQQQHSQKKQQQQGTNIHKFQGDEDVSSNALEELIQQQFLVEAADSSENRRQAVRELALVLQQWADHVVSTQAQTKNTHQEHTPADTPNNDPSQTTTTTTKASVALVCMGSYRLGVHTPSSDVDCICVAPPTLTRGDFFTSLVSRLQSDDRFCDVHPIPSAYTPVLKFLLRGLAIDLLFCRLASSSKLDQLSSPEEEFQLSVDDLIGLDEQSIRSLNGARVAQFLLETVPNIDNYRATLRAVKFWATAKGLYSNVLGFLGGVNWAILVAWVCKRFPSAKPPTLLKAFFCTYAQWHWPSPVTLLETQEQPPPRVLQLPVWSARNPRDSAHLLPILTPTYPSMNSSYNVGIPQRRRLTWELQYASNIMRLVETGSQPLAALFHRDFFRQHYHFLVIHILAPNASLFLEWYRFCESRLRLLITGLEASPDSGVQAWPYAKLFRLRLDPKGRFLGSGPGPSEPDSPKEATFFVGLRFHFQAHVNLRPSTLEFIDTVNAWDGRKAGMDLTMELLTQKELPSYVFEDDEWEGVPPTVNDNRGEQSDSSERKNCNENMPNDSADVGQPQEPTCSDVRSSPGQPQEPDCCSASEDDEPSTGGTPDRQKDQISTRWKTEEEVPSNSRSSFSTKRQRLQTE